MTTLVLGSNGQVGRHLRTLLPDAAFWTRADADLTDPTAVGQAVRRTAADVVVNASAYTAVDRAEADAETAWQVNAASVAAIAAAVADRDAAFVHISTDYVFDGRRDSPYLADDATAPLGVYGRTKLAGELAVQSLCPRHWIVRTSWVFSEFGGNFVKTMLRLAGERDTLQVVGDQRGRPSDARDVARLLAALVSQLERGREPEPGVYHSGGGPETTWHAFAEEIFRRALALGLIAAAPQVREISTAEYPTPAKRPMNAVLEPSGEFQAQLGIRPDWTSGVDRVLRALQEQASDDG